MYLDAMRTAVHTHRNALSEPSFVHLYGRLGPDLRIAPISSGAVILSQISGGQSVSPGRGSIAIKYVAEGTEYYHLSGRPYVVEAGNFLFVPEMTEGEAGRSSQRETAHGLCVYLPETRSLPSSDQRLEEPLLFPAHGSDLGRMLERMHRNLFSRPWRGKLEVAAMVKAVDGNVGNLMADALRSIQSIEAVKGSTRYEIFRRLTLARMYLHDIDDRPVDLAELAKVARMSRFQLTRLFADQFGSPPATYHRRLRLERAGETIASGHATCTEAGFRYGFNGATQFSRAFRKTFGVSPSQLRRKH